MSIHKVKTKDAIFEEAHNRLQHLTRELLTGTATLEEVTEAKRAYDAARLMPNDCVCQITTCGRSFPQADATIIVVARVVHRGDFLVDDTKEKYIVLCPDCKEHTGLISHFEEHERNLAANRDK